MYKINSDSEMKKVWLRNPRLSQIRIGAMVRRNLSYVQSTAKKVKEHTCNCQTTYTNKISNITRNKLFSLAKVIHIHLVQAI